MQDKPSAEKHSVSRRVFAKAALFGASSPYLAKRLRGSVLTREKSPSSNINPLIEASTNQLLGEGKTFPGPTTPFGLVQLSPDTITGDLKGPGYAYEGDSAPGGDVTSNLSTKVRSLAGFKSVAATS